MLTHRQVQNFQRVTQILIIKICVLIKSFVFIKYTLQEAINKKMN